MAPRTSLDLEHAPHEEAVSLLHSDEGLPVTELSEKTPDASTTFLNRLPRTDPRFYLSAVGHFLKRFLIFLIPSFITSRWIHPTRSTEKLRRTAYLDGLRGVAAWTVFNYHLAFRLDKGWIWMHIWERPFVHLLWSGNFAVALFFVISGFALSIGPIAQLNKIPRDPAAAMSKLASATFRRPMRLLIPALISTIYVFVLIRVGYFKTILEGMEKYLRVMKGERPGERHWMYKVWFRNQLWDLLECQARLFQIFRSFEEIHGQPMYNGPLWTIVLELRASFILFLTHVSFYYMSPRTRVAMLFGLLAMGIATNGMDIPLFWAGYLIAEFDKPPPSERTGNRAKHFFVALFWWAVAFFGLFIGSYPDEWPETNYYYKRFFRATPFHYPDRRFWTGVGAGITLLGISKVQPLQMILCSRPIQYLGKISFSLYLVHEALITSLSIIFYGNVWMMTGRGPYGGPIGFVIAYILTLGSIICVADIFWRAVDIPSVDFAFRLQKLVFSEK